MQTLRKYLSGGFPRTQQKKEEEEEGSHERPWRREERRRKKEQITPSSSSSLPLPLFHGVDGGGREAPIPNERAKSKDEGDSEKREKKERKKGAFLSERSVRKKTFRFSSFESHDFSNGDTTRKTFPLLSIFLT